MGLNWGGLGTFWGLSVPGSVFGAKTDGSTDTAIQRKYKVLKCNRYVGELRGIGVNLLQNTELRTPAGKAQNRTFS